MNRNDNKTKRGAFEAEIAHLFNKMERPIPPEALQPAPTQPKPQEQFVPQHKVWKITYGYDKIYEEVYKRTSFVAKNRPTETLVHQLSTMSFTRDEDFMFKPFIMEASANIFEVLSPFCKHIHDAYSYVDAPVTHTLDVVPNVKEFLKLGETKDYKTNRLWHDDARGSRYRISFTIPVEKIKPVDCSKWIVGAVVQLDWATKYYGENMAHSGYLNLRFSSKKNEIPCSYEFDIKENVFGEQIETMERVIGATVVKYSLMPKSQPKPETWKAGSYVEVAGEEPALYKVLQDVPNVADLHDNRLFEPLDKDEREAVVYRINILDWMDENAFKGVEVAIFEALVNFVMYKWFLFVAPEHADIYNTAYENNLIQIKNRINAQKKPVNRKYHLF